MKTTISAFQMPAVLMAILLFGCAKTTSISGKVISAVDGEPVKNLPVMMNIYNGVVKDSSIKKKVDEENTTTDENGRFSMEYTGTGIDAAGLEFGGGFCGTYFDYQSSPSIKANKSVDTVVKIDLIDGNLNLILHNNAGLTDSLFVRVDCDVMGEKGFVCCNLNYANKLLVGASDTLHFRVTAGRFVSVYWGEQAFPQWASPHVDSVFCKRDATTDLTIDF